jgi:acyl carrier protein
MLITRESARLVASRNAVLAALAAPFFGCAAAHGMPAVTPAQPLAAKSDTKAPAPPQGPGATRQHRKGCQTEAPPSLRLSTTFQRFARILRENLDVSEENICPESTFIDDLGADSLGLVELVLATEEEFELDIPDEDTENLRTVRDVVAYLDARHPTRQESIGTRSTPGK